MNGRSPRGRISALDRRHPRAALRDARIIAR